MIRLRIQITVVPYEVMRLAKVRGPEVQFALQLVDHFYCIELLTCTLVEIFVATLIQFYGLTLLGFAIVAKQSLFRSLLVF